MASASLSTHEVVDTDPEENRIMLLIATAAGATFKFFGSDRDDTDDDVRGDHPIVRALFCAVNTGDFAELEDVIHEDSEVYAIGYRLKSDSVDSGPALMVETSRRSAGNSMEICGSFTTSFPARTMGSRSWSSVSCRARRSTERIVRWRSLGLRRSTTTSSRSGGGARYDPLHSTSLGRRATDNRLIYPGSRLEFCVSREGG